MRRRLTPSERATYHPSVGPVWRNGRRDGLKIRCPSRTCGFKSLHRYFLEVLYLATIEGKRRCLNLHAGCRLHAMSAQPFKVRVAARRLTAFAIVLWLAGAGCLLGCEMVASASPAVDAHAHAHASAQSCTMHSGGACCHKAKRPDVKRNTETAGTPAPARSIPDLSCCPLANRAADPARKVRLSGAARVIENRGLPRALDEAAPPAEFHALKSQPRDRGSTHLRCCVFLI